jgi:hypothetical protein
MKDLASTESRRIPRLSGDPQVDNALWRLSLILREITDSGAQHVLTQEDNESSKGVQVSE